MKFLKSTKKWSEYWKVRKIDWNQAYLQTWNHPHRFLISSLLKTFGWMSLFEIGCGAGANLVNIVKSFPGKTIQLGGCDINPDAIELARKTLQGAILRAGAGNDILLSDKSSDVVLTDRLLIYVSPRQIDDYIAEIKRIARKRVVLCEFYCPRWHGRIKLRLTSGYFAYDYRALLDRHGFNDIIIYEIPEAAWPGDTYPSFIIIATPPSR